MKYFKFLLIFTLLLSHITTQPIYAYEMTLDDEEEDMDDFNSFITKAKNLANSKKFSKAYESLNSANKLGVDTLKIKNVREYISKREKFAQYIKEAKSQAKNENFSSADTILGKAKSLGVNSREYERAKSYMSSQRSAYNSRIERARSRVNSSSGSRDVDFVYVKAEIVTGLFGTVWTKSLYVSGGSGTYIKGVGGSGSIHKGYNGGLSGRYSWSATFSNNRSCSGSFYLSGKKRNYTIRVYSSCNDAGSSEY